MTIKQPKLATMVSLAIAVPFSYSLVVWPFKINSDQEQLKTQMSQVLAWQEKADKELVQINTTLGIRSDLARTLRTDSTNYALLPTIKKN